MKHVRSFVAAGGSKARRALFLAVEELFTNVVVIFRDAAHALRISCKSPLHLDELFGEVWEELFNKRHALVPDIMNSDKCQSLFQEIQKTVLQIPCEHRPLAVILEHLRFAQQRFDSSAGPMAKVAFMLLPIATLLACIGCNNRHKKEDRERAMRLLKKLDSNLL